MKKPIVRKGEVGHHIGQKEHLLLTKKTSELREPLRKKGGNQERDR